MQIENFKIIFEAVGVEAINNDAKQHTLEDLVLYYGVPFFLVFRKYYPNPYDWCGQAFAKIPLQRTMPDGCHTRKKNHSFYQSRYAFQLTFLSEIIFPLIRHDKKQMDDFSILERVYTAVNEVPMIIRLFTKKIKPARDFIKLHGETLSEYSFRDRMVIRMVLNKIIGEINRLTTDEFELIQNEIYKHTCNQFRVYTQSEASCY